MLSVTAKISLKPMQYLIIFVFTSLLCVSCASGDDNVTNGHGISAQLDELRNTFAPDRRTDRVEAIIKPGKNAPDTLVGYTTLAEVKRKVDSIARSTGMVNDLRYLPDTTVGAGFGLIRVSVANIRTEAGHSQELTSQALMGTPVMILDEQDGWYLIRTPDRYLAWLEEGAIAIKGAGELDDWFSSQNLRTCVPAQSFVTAMPGREEKIVSELVAGNILMATGKQQREYAEVLLPDDRKGWVPAKDLRAYAALASPDGLTEIDLLNTAFSFEGRPYLWGGTSPKAMDCSGLTKTAYYLNGYVIPRDASQQVHAGTELNLDEEFSHLESGDLLFFGKLREDGSHRVTHVGFYLGEGRMLHAGADNSYITENSLREGDDNFAAHRRESLLSARRLVRGSKGVVRIDSAFQALYTKSSSR